jgi:hypothetical protein
MGNNQQYSAMRARVAALGLTQTGRMKEPGDYRVEKNIIRSIQRMIAGDVPVSGPMLALLEEKQRGVARGVQPKEG